MFFSFHEFNICYDIEGEMKNGLNLEYPFETSPEYLLGVYTDFS